MKTTPIADLRIATPASFMTTCSRRWKEAVRNALAVLSRMIRGVTSDAPLMKLSMVSGWLGDASAYPEDLIRKYGLSYMAPDRTRFERLMNPPAGTKVPTSADDARARERLLMMRHTIDDVFKDFEVVVPTIRNMPPMINDSLDGRESSGAEANKEIYDWFDGGSACSNTSPVDVYGIPAITVPCGFSSSGMPTGIIVAASHFKEATVLALAYATRVRRSGISGLQC